MAPAGVAPPPAPSWTRPQSFCVGQAHRAGLLTSLENAPLLRRASEGRLQRPWKTASGLERTQGGSSPLKSGSSLTKSFRDSLPAEKAKGSASVNAAPADSPCEKASRRDGVSAAESLAKQSAFVLGDPPSLSGVPSPEAPLKRKEVPSSAEGDSDPAALCGSFFRAILSEDSSASGSASDSTPPLADGAGLAEEGSSAKTPSHAAAGTQSQQPREAPEKAGGSKPQPPGPQTLNKDPSGASSAEPRRSSASASKICDFEADADESALNKISLEYSYEEVKAATDGFRRLLGIGAYGVVYHGFMRDGIEVAVKRLNDPSEAGFEREVVVLSKFRHPNLVILLGFARHGKDRFLIYEMMAGGDVAGHLERGTLTWFERVCIALDTSIALSHLHRHCPTVYHRDIKTSNILLDKHKTAKVSDFGLACLAKKKTGKFAVRQTAGTVGYADPKYIASSLVSEKTEVYSLGMVMLELLTAKAPAVLHADGSATYVLSPLAKDFPRLMREADVRANFPLSVIRFFAGLGTSVGLEPELPNFHDWRRHAQWHLFEAHSQRQRDAALALFAPHAARRAPPAAAQPRQGAGGVHCCDHRPPRVNQRAERQSPLANWEAAEARASSSQPAPQAAKSKDDKPAAAEHPPPSFSVCAAHGPGKTAAAAALPPKGDLNFGERGTPSPAERKRTSAANPKAGEASPSAAAQMAEASSCSAPIAASKSLPGSVLGASGVSVGENGGLVECPGGGALPSAMKGLPAERLCSEAEGKAAAAATAAAGEEVDGGPLKAQNEALLSPASPLRVGRGCGKASPAGCLARAAEALAGRVAAAGASFSGDESAGVASVVGGCVSARVCCCKENLRQAPPEARRASARRNSREEAAEEEVQRDALMRRPSTTAVNSNAPAAASGPSSAVLEKEAKNQGKERGPLEDSLTPLSRHVDSQLEIERQQLCRHLEMQQRELSLRPEELSRLHSLQRSQHGRGPLLAQERRPSQPPALCGAAHSDGLALQSAAAARAGAAQPSPERERASTETNVSPPAAEDASAASASFLSGPPASMSCVPEWLRCDTQSGGGRKTPSHGRRRRHKPPLASEGECRLLLKQQQRRLRGCTDSSVSTMTNGGSSCSIRPSSGNLYSRSSNSWNSCTYSNNSIQSSVSVVATDRMFLYADFLGEASSSPQGGKCLSGKAVAGSLLAASAEKSGVAVQATAAGGASGQTGQTTPATSKSLRQSTSAAAVFAASSSRVLRTVAPLSRVVARVEVNNVAEILLHPRSVAAGGAASPTGGESPAAADEGLSAKGGSLPPREKEKERQAAPLHTAAEGRQQRLSDSAERPSARASAAAAAAAAAAASASLSPVSAQTLAQRTPSKPFLGLASQQQQPLQQQQLHLHPAQQQGGWGETESQAFGEAGACGSRRLLTVLSTRHLVAAVVTASNSASPPSQQPEPCSSNPAQQEEGSARAEKNGAWLRKGSVCTNSACVSRGGTLPTILVSNFTEAAAGFKKEGASAAATPKQLYRSQQQQHSSDEGDLQQRQPALESPVAAAPTILDKFRAFF